MKLNKSNLPKHIGIIMDGNGRWASKRGLPRLAGHKMGVEAMRRTITLAQEFKVPYLTFFAFSTENWKRSKEEIDGIFDIVREYLKTEDITETDIKLVSMGDLSALPSDLRLELEKIVEKTKNNAGMVLNLGVNYGGRAEIAYACNKLKHKEIITVDDIASELYTKDMPDPDLIIRTSGEQRLSGFMLFQCAYSEIYFEKAYWPSFGKRQFIKALKFYSNRDRRFGGDH